MKLVDLTMAFGGDPMFGYSLRSSDVVLPAKEGTYTGVIYELACSSMCGTYIDFPGHIRETSDGVSAGSADPADYFRVKAAVVHMSRASGSGPVSGAELEAAAGGPVKTDCLVINALGGLEPMDIANRTVWFGDSAVDWIIGTGCRLLVSDIYESNRVEGVFLKLFGKGVTTVCLPAHLHKLPASALVTVMFCPVPGMMQVPCRMVAEIE